MYNTDMPTRAELPTTQQLLRSTAIAIASAAVLLVTVVLPAEYAVDPTGVGRVLGLTQMGEIKQQLAEEAANDDVISAATIAEDEVPLAEDTTALQSVNVSVSEAAPDQAASAWRDEVTLTLAPGEAAEIKLVMKLGETSRYEWRVDQGHVNSDLHGDGTAGQSTSYRKGRAEASDTGELTAAFDGSHGWFWRNRSDVPVTLVLQTTGDYSELKRVL
ncbi:MAG: transmembrane anchor protein [Hyphomonas sp. 34-62-18]|nr:transmembrane anchor protein [Hyphomonas sp. 34-62-18]OZB17850.1 MAG: transmembrane anchor protein [Hyphomonas sp. 34-62-18]